MVLLLLLMIAHATAGPLLAERVRRTHVLRTVRAAQTSPTGHCGVISTHVSWLSIALLMHRMVIACRHLSSRSVLAIAGWYIRLLDDQISIRSIEDIVRRGVTCLSTCTTHRLLMHWLMIHRLLPHRSLLCWGLRKRMLLHRMLMHRLMVH